MFRWWTMATLDEQRTLLDELSRLGLSDLNSIWKLAIEADDPLAFILDAYPELMAQYGTIVAELSAQWYDEALPPGVTTAYAAAPALVPAAEKFRNSAAWALNSGDGSHALDKLAGTFQRGMWDMDRETQVINATEEPGSQWVRHASANACPFCKVLATRGAVYTSRRAAERVVGRGKEMSLSDRRARARGENRDARHRFRAGGVKTRGTQKLGDKFHDNCHCRAIAVRPGGSYEAPPYVEKWQQEYIDASREVAPGAGAGDLKDILRVMAQNERK